MDVGFQLDAGYWNLVGLPTVQASRLYRGVMRKQGEGGDGDVGHAIRGTACVLLLKKLRVLFTALLAMVAGVPEVVGGMASEFVTEIGFDQFAQRNVFISPSGKTFVPASNRVECILRRKQNSAGEVAFSPDHPRWREIKAVDAGLGLQFAQPSH